MRKICFAMAMGTCAALYGAKTPAGYDIPDVPQETLELAVEPGEGWWGGCSTFGTKEPFGLNKTEFNFDNRRHSSANASAPLLVSTHGRYVWCEQGFGFQLKDGKIRLSSDGVKFETGRASKTLRDAYLAVMQKHFPPQNKTADLLFVSAPQWNTWIELGLHQTQKAVLEYAHKILDCGFPPGVLMIDDTWQRDYGTWRFDSAAFPDPKAMCDELHQLGFRVILWTCPFVSMDSAEYRHLESKGALLKDGYGRPAAIRWWDGVSAVLDFDKPYAKDWYRGELQKLMKDYGIDGFKFDAGDTGYYDTADQRVGYVGREKEGELNRHNGNWTEFAIDYPFNELRASWKHGNAPVVQRLCDKGAGFRGVQQLIPDMIATGLLGHGYLCPDMIGGGELSNFWHDKVNEEAFIRSAQVHALCPMMQFSAAPWRVLSKENFEIIKKLVALRQKYAPRFVELAKECAKTGEPMLRSMDYMFPGCGFDQGCGYEKITDQFIMGDFLVVAPQTKMGAKSRMVAVPPGAWQADDGTVVVGPRTFMVETPLDRLPYFERIDPKASRWPAGRKAAFQLAFDDGCLTHLTNAIPLLKKYRIPGTFYLCGGWDLVKNNAWEWREAAQSPYVTLGNHTYRHCGAKDLGEFEYEVFNGAESVHSLTPNTPWPRFVSFAQPGGVTWNVASNDCTRILKEIHSNWRPEFSGPKYGVEATEAACLKYIDDTIASDGYGHFDFHGIGGDWLSTDIKLFEAILKKLDAERDKLWLTTDAERQVWESCRE